MKQSERRARSCPCSPVVLNSCDYTSVTSVDFLFADGAVELVGNRTECGLLQMAVALGADYKAMRKEGQILRTFPFSSERKRMTSIVSEPGSRCAQSLCPTFQLRFRVRISPLSIYSNLPAKQDILVLLCKDIR